MELHSENISALDRARKTAAVMSASHRFRNHWGAVRMRVVDKRAILNAAKQTGTLIYPNAVPAHVRRLYFGRESRAVSGKQGCARGLGRFCAAFEQPLHSYADSQKRNSP